MEKNIIAVTACLKRCSIAFLYGGKIFEDNQEIDSATNLAWLVDSVIKQNNIDLQKINGIITASGPGSFTGIRVAQSFAKGIALSLKIPSASVSYFDVIEHEYLKKNSDIDHQRLVVIKSEKQQTYYRFYSEGVSSYENLVSVIAGKSNIALIGDAIDEVLPYIKNEISSSFYISDFRKAKYLLDFPDLVNEKSRINVQYISAIDKKAL